MIIQCIMLGSVVQEEQGSREGQAARGRVGSGKVVQSSLGGRLFEVRVEIIIRLQQIVS